MNTSQDLLKRLIKLFPVKVLKEEFNLTSTSDSLYDEIIQNINESLIKDFVYSNINLTKQHIYIYDIDKTFNINSFKRESFPFPVIKSSSAANELTIVISPIVDFSVVLSNPYEETNIQFHQPFIIRLKEKKLIIQSTILEKKIGAYFESNRKVLDVVKVNDELESILKVMGYFLDYSFNICDLNKGVKHMWEKDTIDSKYVKWKKNRSTTTESMDEDYTLKSQYPDVYKSLMKSPLNKTIFKYLLNDELLPEHFTIDPSNGELSVPIFPKNQNQIRNVIDGILSQN
ncbi:MAG TPA: hypothetical protein DIW31_01680 [Bacteroidales bacterium]|nr:hypothetical protein [Bacteroidales bacterium]